MEQDEKGLKFKYNMRKDGRDKAETELFWERYYWKGHLENLNPQGMVVVGGEMVEECSQKFAEPDKNREINFMVVTKSMAMKNFSVKESQLKK